MTRTDMHRPSAIVPADYEYVAPERIRDAGFETIELLEQFRRIIRGHMERTGGTYSRHEHGGNCMVCGSVNAVYTILFYHEKTNSYVRMGADCAEQVDMGGWQGEFRQLQRAVKDARAREKGRTKAQLVLAENGLARCWEIAEERARALSAWVEQTNIAAEEEQAFFDQNTHLDWDYENSKRFERPAPPKLLDYNEERTVADIVSKLVRYGSISENQINFLRSLLDRIEKRSEIEASRAAEREAAKEAPEGRITFEGEVIKAAYAENYYGSRLVLTIKTEDGWMAWGTAGSRLGGVRRGDRVRLTATLERSEKDAKFAFFKRPAKQEVLSRA